MNGIERLELRPIGPDDDAPMAAIIRQVLSEFALNREGFAFVDPELDHLHASYLPPRAGYFVLARGPQLLGGAGFAALEGGDGVTAELKKMYFLPQARSLGFGQKLMRLLLDAAMQGGYKQIYLETTEVMPAAIKLYEKSGFQRLNGPLGDTGHFGCTVWMLRQLRP